MAVSRFIDVFEAYDRFANGKRVTEQQWDYEIIPRRAKMLKESYDLFFRPYTRKTTVWEDALQQTGGFLDPWQNPSDAALMATACDNAQKIIENAIAAE